jgi:hypothetical protein
MTSRRRWERAGERSLRTAAYGYASMQSVSGRGWCGYSFDRLHPYTEEVVVVSASDIE